MPNVLLYTRPTIPEAMGATVLRSQYQVARRDHPAERFALPGMSRTFLLGRLLATPRALFECEAAGVSPMRYLIRHASQDWGTLSTDDKRANDRALQDGSRVLSAYILPGGTKIWIITRRKMMTASGSPRP